MRKLFFTIILLGSVSTVFSQVNLTLDQYNGLVNKIDSLKAGLKRATNDYTNQEKELNNQIDSLTTQSQKLKQVNITLTKEKTSVQTELKTLRIKTDSLTSNSEENRLTIQDLTTNLNRKTIELDSLSKQKRISDLKQYEKGQQDVINAVTAGYATLSFDQMIVASSQKQVSRDLSLVNDESLKQKLKDLDIYFSGKEVLTQKLNMHNVQYALEMTKTIKEQSDLVKKLTDNLDNYKLRNDGLKEAIQKIQNIDNRFIANTDKDQEEKEALILSQIAWYFYNYQFNNFEDYPYLSDIIIGIMKTKHKDANSDITELLNEL